MENQNKAFGIACLVCGILSLLCCCCSEWLGIGLAVASIVLFILERTVAKQKTRQQDINFLLGEDMQSF